jgi:outer membrane protein TolC
MKNLKKYPVFILLAFTVFPVFIFPQTDILTLEQCQQYALANYPVIKQKDLINKSRDYNIANVWKGYFPQLTISGQATYQSDVTQIPISLPNMKFDPLTQDQYKVIADISQTIYDGGAIAGQSDVYSANALVDVNKNEVDLHKVKEQVMQIYFGILLINEQLVQNDIMKKDLDATLLKITGALQNGTSTLSNVNVMKAELIKTEQKRIELASSKKAYIDMLSLLMNKQISENNGFIKPASPVISDAVEITRPEMNLFSAQEKLLSEQEGLVVSKVLPKASLFFQGGYGKPGFNMLKNEFCFYYITGLRFSWPVSNFYTFGNEKQIIELNKNIVGLQKDAFVLNTNVSIKQQLRDIEKLKELIVKDKLIIELKTSVKIISKSQLENGIITSSDFIRDLNEEDQAKQNLLLHIIQLSKAEQAYLLTVSN